jgi:hypothetical protein
MKRAVLCIAAISTVTFGGAPQIVMFAPTVQELTAIPITDAGAAKPIDYVKIELNQFGSCSMSPRHGTKTYTAWYEGNVDARGKLTFDTDNHEGGSSEDVTSCTEDVLTRNTIKLPPGRYRLNAKVTLRRLKDGELP